MPSSARSARDVSAILEGIAYVLIGAFVMAFVHGEGVRPRPFARPGQSLAQAAAAFASAQVNHFCDHSRGVAGHDSYYHIKMSAMLPEWGLVETFPWLRFVYFTREGQDFVSHHYGFHVLMQPFVRASKALTGDWLAGGRWATELFFGLALAMFNALLRQANIRHRGVWLVLFLLLPSQFFGRHAFVRAISPSLAFMLAICWLAFANRYILLGLALALYTHLYLGAVMYSPVIVASYALACVAGGGGLRRFPWAVVLCGAAGWAAGAATYPYFDGMVEFLRLQVFATGLSPDIEVGNEWRPYSDPWWFVRNQAGAVLGVWVAAVLVRARRGPRLNAAEATLLVLHFAFLLLTFKARRFIEYWPVFCLLSAAFLAGRRLDGVVAWLSGTAAGIETSGGDGAMPTAERKANPTAGAPAPDDRAAADEVRGGVDGWSVAFAGCLLAGLVAMAARPRHAHVRELAWAWPLWAALLVYVFWILVRNRGCRAGAAAWMERGRDTLLAAACACALAIATARVWLDIRQSARPLNELEPLRAAMAYLTAHSSPGDVVFTTDWDDFPVFFYYNSHNHYVVGLDPKFTHERRPDLWERYVRLTRGQVPRTSSATLRDASGRARVEKLHIDLADIREHFGARYVVTDRDHKPLARKLARAKDVARLVYPGGSYEDHKNDPYLIFAVVDPAASRPAEDPAVGFESANMERTTPSPDPSNPTSQDVP